jgi:Tfp pilus assembly protein PilP
MAYGLARIVFDATPAGDRELAAFVAKERRAVATTVKAIRHIRELVGQDYANRCIFWEPIAIGIEGATVVTQAEQSAATPAPASKPGLLQRITDAFTPGRAAA